MFAGGHGALALLWHLAAKHLKHQGGELHAMLGLKWQRAILLGVLFVQAAEVSELLDHLRIEEASPRVVHSDVGLQDLWKMVLKLFHMPVVLDTRTIWDREVNAQGEKQRRVMKRGNEVRWIEQRSAKKLPNGYNFFFRWHRSILNTTLNTTLTSAIHCFLGDKCAFVL